MASNKLVSAIFNSRAAAEGAVDAILRNSYGRDEISVVMSDSTRAQHFALETGTQAAQGAGVGGAVGGTVGAVVAALIAVGSNLVIPGIGLVIAGPIAAALAGLGAGAAAGGLVGALVGAGIPEHRAKIYEAGLKSGGILIGVHAKSDKDADMLERILAGFGGEGVKKERLGT